MEWWDYRIPASAGFLLMAAALFWPTTRRKRFAHMLSLQGKHVVVTGGSSGIGFCIAMQCAAEGAFVTLMSRSHRHLEEAKRLIKSSLDLPDESIRLQSVDVGNAGMVALAIRESFDWRPIDVLVCSAGIIEPDLVEDVKPSRVEEIARTNILGVMFPIQSVIPLMRARSKDHPCSIVIIGSLCFSMFLYGANVYNASKAAVKALAEMLRFELLPWGIGVTLAVPGFTQTPMFDEASRDETFHEVMRKKLYKGLTLESADEVARRTIKGFKRNEFLVSTTFAGFVGAAMGRGFLPAESFPTFVAELLLMVPARIVSFLMLRKFKRILLCNPAPSKTVP